LGHPPFVVPDESRSDRTDSIFPGEQERIQYHEPRIWGWYCYPNLHNSPDASHASVRRLDQCHSPESNLSRRKLDIHDSWGLEGVRTDPSFWKPYSFHEFRPAEHCRAAGYDPKHEAFPGQRREVSYGLACMR